MSTIGHPLSDLSNLTVPFFTCRRHGQAEIAFSDPGFLPGRTPGLPTIEQIYTWYADAAGWSYSSEELSWGMVFSIFRVAGICQGIAARVARRQASSAEARKHANSMFWLGEFAWDLARETQSKPVFRPDAAAGATSCSGDDGDDAKAKL